jgi:hypothetical protein
MQTIVEHIASEIKKHKSLEWLSSDSGRDSDAFYLLSGLLGNNDSATLKFEDQSCLVKRKSDDVIEVFLDNNSNMVEHPSHYGGKDNPYEAIKVIHAWGLSYDMGNAVKYIARADKKDNPIQDLRKAIMSLEFEIKKRQS